MAAGRQRAVRKSPPKKGRTRSVGKSPPIATIPPNPTPTAPPKPLLPKPTPPPKNNERLLTYNGDGALHPLIYGEVHDVGAAVSYWKALSGNRLLVRYIIGYGPIHSIFNIRIDRLSVVSLGIFQVAQGYSGAEVMSGYQTFTGTHNQPVSNFMTWNRPGWIPSRAPGVAYVDIVYKDYTNSTVNTFPDITAFKCDVKGLLIRDPAQDPTLVNRYFSEDAALIIADLLTSQRYGGRVPDANINWTHISTDVSPYIMQDLGGGVKRYPIGLILLHKQDLDAHIEHIRAHAQLSVVHNNGFYNIIVDKPRAYSGIHITDEDIDEGSKLRTKGTSEVYQRIELTYTDSAQEWTQKSTPVELPNISNTSTPISEAQYSVIGSRTLAQTKRIGTYLLNRSIQDKVIYFKTNQIGKKPLPGDRIKITDFELNLEAQDIIITNVDSEESGWSFIAEIYDEDVYSSVVQTELVSVEPATPSPHDVPDAPTDLVLTQEKEGDNFLKVKIEFTPAEVNYNSQFTRIMVRETQHFDEGDIVGQWYKLTDTTDSVAYLSSLNRLSTWEIEMFTMTSAPFNLASAILAASLTLSVIAQDVTMLKGSGLHQWEGAGATAPKTLWWDDPKERDYIREKADGGYTVTIGTEVGGVIKANSAGFICQIDIDLGAGNEKAFRELELIAPNDGSYFTSEINYSLGGTDYDLLAVMYEDPSNPGQFNRVTTDIPNNIFEIYYPLGLTRKANTSGGVNQTRFIKQQWGIEVSSRKWRIQMAGKFPSRVIAISNFKLSTFGDTKNVVGYNLSDYMVNGGVESHIQFIPAASRPTESKPLDITKWVQQIGTTKRASILVRAVDNFQQESEGVAYFHEFTGTTQSTPAFTQEIQTLQNKTLDATNVVPWSTITGAPTIPVVGVDAQAFDADLTTLANTYASGVFAYNAANFTATTGTWGVDDADETISYVRIGALVLIAFEIVNTDVSSATFALKFTIPTGWTAAHRQSGKTSYLDAGSGVWASGEWQIDSGTSVINFYKSNFAGTWTATTGDNTNIRGTVVIRIN